MKKYLFGLLAVALAISFSAYTTSANNLTTANFIFDESLGNRNVQSDVNDPFNYREAVSETCPGGDEVACRINGVDEAYWNTTWGPKLLNAFVIDFDSQTDALMHISSADFHIQNTSDTYYVTSASSFTTIDNKQR
jgi:hypothetical protein